MERLDELTTHWQWALEAGGRALDAAGSELRAGALDRHRSALAHERTDVAALLARVAREEHAHSRPWLPAFAVTPRLLGLPTGTAACVFDVDGVLADAGVVHARAWAQVLDDLLLHRAAQANRVFAPFDPVADYAAYIDGRPRLEGVRAFLASRGITLPAEALGSVAAAKGLALRHAIDRTGVVALPAARSYLVAAGFAHLGRAVVSTSTAAAHVLEHADLAPLVDVYIDGDVVAARGIRPRPEPDMLLAACDQLDVAPAHAVSLTRSAAGVAAAHAAGMKVIVVGRPIGDEPVVPSLAELLDPQLRASANGAF